MTAMPCSHTEIETRVDHSNPLAPVFRLLCLVMLPHLAWAEGAERVLDCNVTQVCDAGGDCEAASDEVGFRLAPENLREDGSGQYRISYGDIQASMEATTYAGPFYWTTGTERNALLASSETQFLWHRLALNPAPEARVYFLTCSLRQ